MEAPRAGSEGENLLEAHQLSQKKKREKRKKKKEKRKKKKEKPNFF